MPTAYVNAYLDKITIFYENVRNWTSDPQTGDPNKCLFTQKLGSGLETSLNVSFLLSRVAYVMFCRCERVSVSCESEKIHAHTH